VEERQVTRKWFQIAKSEFLVSTSRLRGKRKVVLPAVYILGVLWALFIVPSIMSLLIGEFGAEINVLLMVAFPGLMRSTVMLVWLMLLIYPMSSSLQEIKVGQWEIMLSHDVRTRSIMVGAFVAKIPVYGLFTLFLAPVLISPFAIIFGVSFIGQAFMYLAIFLFAISTLWLSSFLATAIQARLGESSRGNDLAKALAWVLAIVIMVPMYSIIYFAAPLSEMFGTNVFLFFPFTWGADLITWIVISFNGVGLNQSIINTFQSVLGLNWFADLLLFSVFSLVIVGLAFASAGRLFRIGAGARTEKVVTVRKDGPVMRLIRRVSPGPFGILLTSSLKDFMRKAQNVSQLAYMVILSVIYPLFWSAAFGASSFGGDPFLRLFITAAVLGMILAILGGITFGGIGFLDSQDQLWIIKTAPKGATKFMKARIIQALLMNLIVATIPAVILFLFMNYSLVDTIVIWIYAYASLCGAAMVGIGITANNPMYDDTQSRAFKSNRSITMLIVVLASLMWFYVAAFAIQPWTYGLVIGLPIMIAPLLLVGLLTVYLGAKRLSRPMR
jgi:hypothetical protein